MRPGCLRRPRYEPAQQPSREAPVLNRRCQAAMQGLRSHRTPAPPPLIQHSAAIAPPAAPPRSATGAAGPGGRRASPPVSAPRAVSESFFGLSVMMNSLMQADQPAPATSPSPAGETRSGQRNARRSGCLFALVEGGVANPAQPFQVAAHGADIGPGDALRRPIEVLRAQADETRWSGIDLAL